MPLNWKYNISNFKRLGDIFPEDKFFLVFKKRYIQNIRKYYSVNSTRALHKRIYKDYLNIAIDYIKEGNLVILDYDKRIDMHVEYKEAKESPYDNAIDDLCAGSSVPYIMLNTGKASKVRKLYTVLPSKKVRKVLNDRMANEKRFTQLIGEYVL